MNERELFQQPVVQVTGRVLVRGADARVKPNPLREENNLFEWEWQGPDSPQGLNVEIPLQFSAYVPTYLRYASSISILSIGGTKLEAYPSSMAAWSGLLLGLLALMVASSFASVPAGTVIRPAVTGLLLLVATTVHLSHPDFPFYFGYVLVPLSCMGCAAAICAPKRLVIPILVSSVLLVAAIATSAGRAGTTGESEYLHLIILTAFCGASLLVLVILRFKRWLWEVLPVADGRVPWRIVRGWVPGVMAATCVYGAGWMLGQSLERREFARMALLDVSSLPYLAIPFVLSVSIAVIVKVLIRYWRDDPPPTGMLIALGVTWGLVAFPNELLLLGVSVPIGVLALGVCMPAIANKGPAVDVLNGEIDVDMLGDHSIVHSLLNHGPTGQVFGNVRVAAELGGLIAVIPVAYFVWGALDSIVTRTRSFSGGAFLAGSVTEEIARWLVTAVVFGLLYSRLPGWNGPIKAATLSAVFFASSAIRELVARWAGTGGDRLWTFPALQLLLFLVVLSVSYDYATMRQAGGRWADLVLAYGLERTRSVVVVAAPIALAVLAIGQQVISGTGLDFVRSVLENAPKVASLGR